LDHFGDLNLVLQSKIARIEQLLKLNNFEQDTCTEGSDRGDAFVISDADLLRVFFIVKIRVHFEPIDESFLSHVASRRVHHGERATGANDEYSGLRLVVCIAIGIKFLLIQNVVSYISGAVAETEDLLLLIVRATGLTIFAIFCLFYSQRRLGVNRISFFEGLF
jgi:hypothetical protein